MDVCSMFIMYGLLFYGDFTYILKHWIPLIMSSNRLKSKYVYIKLQFLVKVFHLRMRHVFFS